MSESPPGAGRIAFRVDSSAAIGAGHLRRCLTLAETLRAWGREIIFVCRAHPQSLNGDVEAAGFTLIELPDRADSGIEADSGETAAALAPPGSLEALVVDHYGLGADWEGALRPLAKRIAVIDDLADRPHDCDILIDVAPGAGRYDGLVPDSCLRLIGPAFAILRPDFGTLRAQMPQPDGAINRLLVSFGATDQGNHCAVAVEAIRAALGADVEIDAILGRHAPGREALLGRAAQDPRLHVHVDTDKVAVLMAAADLAIGAGGSSSWERACLGLPALAAETAGNQRDTLAALTAAGCAITLPADDRLASAIEASLALLAANPGLVRLMGAAGRALVDGRGAERVARAVAPPALALRPATADDSRDVWTWRNEPQVRLSSRNSEPIAWEAHRDWFAASLADPARNLLIAEEAKRPVGVLRFDLAADAAIISLYLTPGSQGRGLGVALIHAAEAWLKARHPGVRRILADVLPHNRASLAAFESADYVARLFHYERELSDE